MYGVFEAQRNVSLDQPFFKFGSAQRNKKNSPYHPLLVLQP